VPNQANVYVNNELVGKTPISYEVKRRKEHVVKIEKDGYRDTITKIETKLNYIWSGVSVLGNLFPSFGTGMLVDYSTGAINDITTSKIDVKLLPEPTEIIQSTSVNNLPSVKQNVENEKIISPAVRIRTQSKEYILKFKAAITVTTKSGMRVASHIIEITPTYMTLKKNNTKIYYTDIVKIKMFNTRRWIYATIVGTIPWAISANKAKINTSNCNKKIVEIKVVNHFDRIEYGKTICN
jgi:hypothetical protein